MKSHLFGLVALALAPAMAAQAADLPRNNYAPAPAYQALPTFTWTGYYAGLNAGGNWGSYSGGASSIWGNANGFLAGVTGGYNYQIGQIVLGLEGDWDIDGERGPKALPGPAFGFGKVTNILTLRGRAGFSADRALVYVTGGYAGGQIAGSLGDATVPGYYTTSSWHNGFAVGAGIEYAFTNQISAKAEYLYESLGRSGIFAPPRRTDVGVNENAVRAGVNYHF
jgi:outer membrane immunogenic protein